MLCLKLKKKLLKLLTGTRTGTELEHEQLVKGVNKMRTGKKKKYY